MGLRQREWARKETKRLRSLLGGKCVQCGTTEELEFDVIIPVGNNDHHRRMEWSWRTSFYRKQHDKGNLQLLCQKHNTQKSNQMWLTNSQEVNEPF